MTSRADIEAYPRAFVEDPPSAEIVRWLEKERATECEHERNPCYLRCGVRSIIERVAEGAVRREGDTWHQDPPVMRLIGPWEVIPFEERDRWRRTLKALWLADGARSPQKGK